MKSHSQSSCWSSTMAMAWTRRTLASALTFGGSSRFDDRSSLGRYGMGLPNGALSCARRVEVFSWRGGRVLTSRLDVDEMVRGRRRSLPPVQAVARPAFLPRTPRGTAVVLRRCDRLEVPAGVDACEQAPRRSRTDLSTIHRARDRATGEQRELVAAVDPLFLRHNGRPVGARRFGERLTYELEGHGAKGAVEVVFTELPVDRWHSLSSDEKRRLGVTNAPPVSIMRADREIDRGWYFMGAKRRENYDDWWRCEINFEPTLDEQFGITNAKQGIRPRPRSVDGCSSATWNRSRERSTAVPASGSSSSRQRSH